MSGLHTPWGEMPFASRVEPPVSTRSPQAPQAPDRETAVSQSATGAGTAVTISERAAFFLALIAAAEGRAVDDLAGDLFTEFVVQRAFRIGLPGLLDAMEATDNRESEHGPGESAFGGLSRCLDPP